MSHAVKIEQRFKSIDDLRTAFERCGWSLAENAQIRTYQYDPARTKTFRWVAKNPLLNNDSAFDIGINQEADGTLSLEADWSMGNWFGISTGGKPIGKVAIEYNKIQYDRLAQAHGGVVRYTDLANGQVKMELEIEVEL